MLSRFTRPSFLQWIDNSQGLTRALFGKKLIDHVKSTMEDMGLEHAGFVARPLYACTKRIEGGEMCMKVASMSKFIQQRDSRSHYRCTKCKQKESADSAPVSDSVPLRVLDLYILIRDGNKATFMRSKPYRLCLRAPPSRWAWDADMGCGHELPLTQATPHLVSHRNRKYYEYNDAESEAIWCYSCSYEGKPQ